MSHTLIVSVDPDDPEAVVGAVECSEVTESCRTWWECRDEDGKHEYDKDAYESLIDAVYDGEDSFHGVEHRVIDGMVCTPGVQCIANALDCAADGIYDAAQGLAPGRYPCKVGYEGDEYVSIEVLKSA